MTIFGKFHTPQTSENEFKQNERFHETKAKPIFIQTNS